MFALAALASTSVLGDSPKADRVVDGDTIIVGGVTYRLWGIDAPETKQSCGDGWPAGRMATEYMRGLVQGRNVECEPKATDRYGRTVALCRADGADISAEMVRQGWALAFIRYTRDYVAQEREAKEAKRGVHAHDCEMPWEWRARERGDR